MTSPDDLIVRALNMLAGHLEREIAHLNGVAAAADEGGQKEQAEKMREAVVKHEQDLIHAEMLAGDFGHHECTVYYP